MPRDCLPVCAGRKVSAARDATWQAVGTRNRKDCSTTANSATTSSPSPLARSSMTRTCRLPNGSWRRCSSAKRRRACRACQIQRTLGLGSYKTAWYLCHRIRAAMVEAESPCSTAKSKWTKPMLAVRQQDTRSVFARNKEVVVGIRKRGGELRFFHAKDARGGTLAKYHPREFERRCGQSSVHRRLPYRLRKGSSKTSRAQGKHKTIRHSASIYVKGDIYTNTVESAFSLLKRGIMGSVASGQRKASSILSAPK